MSAPFLAGIAAALIVKLVLLVHRYVLCSASVSPCGWQGIICYQLCERSWTHRCFLIQLTIVTVTWSTLTLLDCSWFFCQFDLAC